MRPKRAPASIVMLHIVIRPSIDIRRTVSPENSRAYPVPPAAPISAITARMTSFGVTKGRSVPVTTTHI